MGIVVIGSIYKSPSKGAVRAPLGQVYVRDTETGVVHLRPQGDTRESPGVPRVNAQTRTNPFQSGSEAAIQPATGGDNTPVRKFFGIMQDMLKQYQGVRADQLANVSAKARKFGEEETSAILQETPDELKRFSPGTQSDIRSSVASEGAGEAGVFSTAVEQQDARAQAFLETFDRMRTTALDLYGDELKRPKDAVLQNYKNLLESGRMDFGDVPDNALPYLMEVIDPDKIQKTPEQLGKELTLKKLQYEVGQLGKLSPTEEIELKQWAAENYPEAPQQAYDAIRGGTVSSEKFTPPTRANLGYTSTLFDFFGVYAPKGDGGNDPVSYANAVARKLGVNPSQPIYDLRDRLDEFAQAIADHEGFTSGASRVARINNNPGNLRFIGQPGAVQGRGGFAAFSSVEAGFEALKNDIRAKMSKPGRAVNTMTTLSVGAGGLAGLPQRTDKDMAKPLSVDEIASLETPDGRPIPIGTTRAQAAAMGARPKTSKEELAASQVSQNALSVAQQAKEALDTLKNTPGQKGAIGAGFQKIIRTVLPGKGPFPGTAASNYLAQLDRLRSILTLDNVKLIRGTGQMSDREVAILQSAATSLSPQMSEKSFNAEIKRLETALSTTVGKLQSVVKPSQGSFSTAEDVDAYLDSIGY